MPMEAIYGDAFASSVDRPRIDVSTAIALSAAPSGFSANSVIRPVFSIFISPKSEARSSSIGRHPMVMSAFTSRCLATNAI